MRLPPHEVELVCQLYTHYNIPSDQYKCRPDDWHRFVNSWNMLANRSDEPGDLLRFLINGLRKNGRLPKLGKGHEKAQPVPEDVLKPEEWDHLRAVYRVIARGSDNFAFDANLANQLEQLFLAKAGRRVPSAFLVALIEAKRKRGEWERLGQGPIPFGDISAIG
ncbi:MAG: hypothetical protein IMZ65_02005 [Planctomycetes bacterium]|nr:hypothetical protein [Planctomycetota bacterium]